MAHPQDGGVPLVRGEVNKISFDDCTDRNSIHAVLNSSLYYLFFCAYTDTRHINPSDVADFPIDLTTFRPATKATLSNLSNRIDACFGSNTGRWKKSGLMIDSINAKPCKPLLDEVDAVLAKHYGFSDEELDHVINYDIKYRMGQGIDEDDD